MKIGKVEEAAEKWNYIRTIETAVINFGGMGTTKYSPANEIRSIPIIDNEGVIIPIRNIEQAYKLLNTF